MKREDLLDRRCMKIGRNPQKDVLVAAWGEGAGVLFALSEGAGEQTDVDPDLDSPETFNISSETA
eukprot:1094421-Pyramimonas_sp.AAC.1